MKSILRPVLKFFSAFLLLYALLIGLSLIPSVGFFFNKIYQGPTEPILQSLLSKAHLQLRIDENDPGLIWQEYASKEKVQQQMRQASQAGKQNMDVAGDRSRVQFYNLFFTFWLMFVALMVVSPLAWKAKFLKILIGSTIFYLFTVFKLWLQLLSTFNQPEIGIYQHGETTLGLVNSMLSVMTLGINLLVILLLWAVLVFDKNNWKAFMEKVEWPGFAAGK